MQIANADCRWTPEGNLQGEAQSDSAFPSILHLYRTVQSQYSRNSYPSALSADATESPICNLQSAFAGCRAVRKPSEFFRIDYYITSQFTAVGARLAPLTSLDEVARFFLAVSANAPNVPSRASTIAQWLGGHLSNAAGMLSLLLETLSSMPNVQRILAALPPAEKLPLGADRTTCVVWQGVLDPAEHCTTAPLFSAKGSGSGDGEGEGTRRKLRVDRSGEGSTPPTAEYESWKKRVRMAICRGRLSHPYSVCFEFAKFSGLVCRLQIATADCRWTPEGDLQGGEPGLQICRAGLQECRAGLQICRGEA